MGKDTNIRIDANAANNANETLIGIIRIISMYL